MRVWLLLLAIGCGGRPACDASCPSCAADEVCVPGGEGHPGICLKKCARATDCPAGLRCTEFEFTPNVWVCASPTVPPLCNTHSANFCDHNISACQDANTLAQGFYAPDNATCGHYLVDCPNGCVKATAVTGFEEDACR